MRHLALTTVFVLGCSSGAKQPTNPTPPDDPGTGATNTADPGGATAGTPAGAKKEEAPPPPDTGGYKVVAPTSLTYAPVDPNNKAGPEVALVTGDTQKGGAFFLKLPPGMNPGLHTHTADYHAVLISGTARHWLPGGDKKAKPLAPGSYWFQPGGQPHGDECVGKDPCVVYIVMSGAFDFTPTPKAKAVKPGKYSLVSRKDLKFNPMDPKQPAGPKMALVSGDPKAGPVAFVIELPPGVNAGLHSHTSEYHALVLDGAPAHWLPHEKNEGEPLAPGTYFFQPGGYDHGDRCTGTEPCHAFVMMPNAMDFKPAAKK